MALQEYTYSIANDTANGEVDTSRLQEEVRGSDITISLDYISTSDDTLSVWFKDALTSAEELELDQIIGSHSGDPLLDPYNDDGVPYVALHGDDNKIQQVGRQGSSDLIRASLNFCDPTTWYDDSQRVTESLTNPSSDGVTWESNNTNWIDLVHGKVLAEDNVRDDGPAHSYDVVVRVDGTEQTQRPPFATDWSQGGDYYVDYENGKVIFQNAPASAPEVDYSYEDGSSWILSPNSGKVIEIASAEAQFTTDVEITDTIHFEIEAPDGQGGWTEVAGEQYKTFAQLVDEAKGAFPDITSLSGQRGISSNMYGFPFQYTAVRLLKSSQNLRLRVYLENDTPFVGERATTTFYCVSYDEQT